MKEKEQEYIILQHGIIPTHNEEVQVILERKPTWIMRWGIVILFLITICFLIICSCIKVPQTVTASIILTSDNPPSDLVAKYTGILDSVYVNEGAIVKQGQLLALMSNPADYGDIVKVETCLVDSASLAPPEHWLDYALGEVQSAWIDYVAALLEYSDYMRVAWIEKKQILLSRQEEGAREYCSKIEAQRNTIALDYDLERISLHRDSCLLSKNIISQVEYDEACKKLLSKQNALAAIDVTIADARLNCLKIEHQRIELDMQRLSEVATRKRHISQAMNALESQIAIWKDRYAIIAPYNGIVSFQNVWCRGQHVTAGDLIVSVAHENEMNIQGRLKVPSEGFGKVEIGQDVNIKLKGFPFMEYGILKGKIVSISKVPENIGDGLYYTVIVSLSRGLESTYHIMLPFVDNMDGSAEIITEDMRLIEQLFRPIKSLFINK